VNTHSKRHKSLRYLLLISLLSGVLVVVFWETTSLGGSREVGAEATAATNALGQANARTVTAYALYEIATRDDPSGSRALLLAREAVQYYLDNNLPLNPEADFALRQAVETAPPWRMTLPRRNHSTVASSAAFGPHTQEGSSSAGDEPTSQEAPYREGHTDAVTSAVYSPDGRFIVTAGLDGVALVWDAGTGQQVRSLQGHTDGIWSAAYSLDGRFIVTASADSTARIWDAATGQQLHLLKRHNDWVNSAVYSPDGRTVVTASWDNAAHIWDAETGQYLRSLEGHKYNVRSAAYSPDGQFIVTASDDRTARIWDAQTGQQLVSLEGHTDSVKTAAFSPDGRFIVTTRPGFQKFLG
jgi:WD40 repeat protein